MRASIVTCLVILVSACAGGDDAAASQHDEDAGLRMPDELQPTQSDSPLSALPPEELMATCEEVFMRHEEAISAQVRMRQSCLQRVAPLSLSEGKLDIAACDADLQRCLAGEAFPEPPTTGPMVTFLPLVCSEPVVRSLAACDARAVDFELCLVALASVLNERGFKSCNVLVGVDSDVGTDAMLLDTPPACEPFIANCGLLD